MRRQERIRGGKRRGEWGGNQKDIDWKHKIVITENPCVQLKIR